MRNAGIAMMVFGALIVVGAFMFNVGITTPASDPARYYEATTVVNMDLIALRAMIHQLGCAVAIIGAVLTAGSLKAR